MSLLSVLATALAAAGVLAYLLAHTRRLGLPIGLPMMLELWTAAGLLTLGGKDWRNLAVAASVLALRTAGRYALRRSERILRHG